MVTDPGHCRGFLFGLRQTITNMSEAVLEIRGWHRPMLAILLLVAELLLLSLMVDASTVKADGVLSSLLAESGRALRWAVVSAGVLAVGLGADIHRRVEPLVVPVSRTTLYRALLVHITIFAFLAVATKIFFGVDKVITGHQGIIWLTLAVAAFVSWCLVVSDFSGWKTFLVDEWRLLTLALSSGFGIYLLGDASGELWSVMSGFHPSAGRNRSDRIL